MQKTSNGRANAAKRSKKYHQTQNGKLHKSKWDAKYHKSNKGKISANKYKQSEKGKIVCMRYRKSEMGRSASKKRVEKYQTTPKGRDNRRVRSNRYYKTPKGKINKSRKDHRRRAREIKSESTLTLKQWERIIQNQNNICLICHEKFTIDNPPTKDHIIPLSKGGGLTFENVQAVHSRCNSIKNNKLDKNNIITWLRM